MSTALLAYPFGGGGHDGSCDCRFHCYPQFNATYDAVAAMRTKHGHAEFGTASSPPKRFLRKYDLWRMYDEIRDVVELDRYVALWEQSVIDPETGAATVTTSDPAPPPGPPIAFSWYWNDMIQVSQTTTPTLRRTVWEHVGLDPHVRVERIETLSEENTTAMLIDATLSDLAAFGVFPPDPMIDGDYYVQGGICYNGSAPWQPASNRTIAVNQWALAADELTFAVQRVRYRIDFPTLLPGTYTIEWDEVFIPDGAASEEDWVVLALCGAGGVTEADEQSDPIELTETRENGEVYVTNVRVTALA